LQTETAIKEGNKMNKWLKFSIPVVSILGLMLTSACAPAGAPPTPAPSEEAVDEERYPGVITPGEETIERKIVKTGHITLEVEDVAETMGKVAEVADELGGYVVSSHKYEREKGTSGKIAMRVPADRFDEAFDRLRQLAIKVPDESTEARDVTEEYVDLQARLHNLEATEAQYLALLEKAETVEEMLDVQRALSDVRGEIERIEGRIKYLERTSDMALIEVSLKETKGLAEPWSVSDAIKSAVRGLTTFGRGLATGFIWLGVFCWVWIPPLVIWLRRRRRA
jgi:methyl coenzyme M reductase subunit D